MKGSQRVLFRFLNASSTLTHRLALPGHRFKVIALDGNALAEARTVPMLELAPAERVDAFVEMDNPGIWILGEARDTQRSAGMGIVIEYAGQQGAPPLEQTRTIHVGIRIFWRQQPAAGASRTLPAGYQARLGTPVDDQREVVSAHGDADGE